MVGMAGVGMKLLVRKDTGSFQIIGMLPGGSARLSGMVQDNDSLLKVGGKDVTGLKLEEVNKLLSGAPGSKVRVKLSRAGMPFDVTLVRAEDSAGKKAPTATPAPPKPAAAPSGKKKLTDREKADRMLNGGVKHYGDDHNTEMAHASKEEAVRLSVEENKRIKEAQKEADRLYDDSVRRDKEAEEQANAKGGAASFELTDPQTWFGRSVQAQEDNKRKHTAHTPPSSWNPFAPKEATPPPEKAHSHWNPFAQQQEQPSKRPASWNPFAPKPAPPKTWYQAISDDVQERTTKVKAAAADVYVSHKIKKAKSQIFGGAKPDIAEAHTNALCSACNACSQPRK